MSMFARVCGVLTVGLVARVCALEPCRIEVVEKGTGWPVPLVHLETTHLASFVSDNEGLIAFDLPELMGRETWFHVRSDGYEVPKDGFGYRGVRFTPRPGEVFRIEVERTAVAKRIGRLTGAGRFAEGRKLDPERAPDASLVLGCDSVQLARHGDKLYWFWGDTTMARYPLGIFDMTGATSGVHPLNALRPPLNIEFEYFVGEQHWPRAVARIGGPGPTWLSGIVSVPDASGTPRLVGTYAKITPPLEPYERGLVLWNETSNRFERHKVLWKKSDRGGSGPPLPDGHASRWIGEDGKEWLLFGNPLPTLKMPATFEGWQDPDAWEVLEDQKELRSVDDGTRVTPHSGSIAWNEFRQRWVTVFMEKFGKPSAFGEIWFAEAKSPLGPWGPAVKVLSHQNYTFYNPRVHPELTKPGSSVLLFEGTYTTQFADKPRPTPRYDYNQILYRLDLDDPVLKEGRVE